MLVSDVLQRPHLGSARLAHATPDARASWCRIASFGVSALVLVAPFESLRPVLRLPGQSLSSVEVVLLAVFLVSALAAWTGRTWPVVYPWPLLPIATLVGVSLVAALLAPAFKGNALHMAARFVMLASVWQLTAAAAADLAARQRVVRAVVISGCVSALLVLADFIALPGMHAGLALFRESIAVVGTQVRASGPFQYPTIASMYLEVTFAVGVGLLLAATATRSRVLLVVVLALIVEGIVLTFTRAGLITAALSLGCLTLRHWRRHGIDRGVGATVVLGLLAVVQVGTSRSAEMLMLRLTTEGQERWFSAVYDVPGTVQLDTRTPQDVPVTITNTGRATWDSNAAERVRLSYHWVEADSDVVVAWEGTRTAFPEPVGPGQSVSVRARVGGPGRPGTFRLMWDIEQERRLWFSTEPDAVPVFSVGTVIGPITSARAGGGPSPRRIPHVAVRPGRIALWTAAFSMVAAHPLLGVGPDNFRLRYGQFSTLRPADPRVHSNSLYVEVLAGMGVAGLAALLWVGACSGREAVRAARRSDLGAGVAAACAAIAVHGLVDSFLSFTATYLLIGVTLGLASAWARGGEDDAHRI